MKYILFLLCIAVSSFAATTEDIVAATIIKEAGGEGDLGMRAVASVIQNRAKKSEIKKVCLKKYQFSCWNAATVNKKVSLDSVVESAKKHKNWLKAKGMASEAIRGELVDVTGGATHYHTKNVKPSWRLKLTFLKRIGAHLFYV